MYNAHMKQLKIISWNVNGIRAAQKKGFLNWLDKESPDIICLQETKAHKEQLTSDILVPQGYNSYWNSSKTKKGYSGTAVITKFAPLKVTYGLGNAEFDQEGSIGRRYRRQDEIGTPYCVTIDFDSLKDKKVTVRDRDTMKQDRVKIEELKNYLWKKLGI